MRRKLIKLVAGLVDDFSRELHALRTPRTLQEMASPLLYVPMSKDETANRPAIVPNFFGSSAPDVSPEHERFDELWYSARNAVAGMNDGKLDQEFRVLAIAVIKALKSRVSEQEICSWPFHDALVSPAFVKEMSERAGLLKTQEVKN